MSRPVDVLAVLDSHASGMRGLSELRTGKLTPRGYANVAADLTIVSAAVAELVAAAESVALFAYEPQDMDRLRAALAKFGGAP